MMIMITLQHQSSSLETLHCLKISTHYMNFNFIHAAVRADLKVAMSRPSDHLMGSQTPWVTKKRRHQPPLTAVHFPPGLYRH